MHIYNYVYIGMNVDDGSNACWPKINNRIKIYAEFFLSLASQIRSQLRFQFFCSVSRRISSSTSAYVCAYVCVSLFTTTLSSTDTLAACRWQSLPKWRTINISFNPWLIHWSPGRRSVITFGAVTAGRRRRSTLGSNFVSTSRSSKGRPLAQTVWCSIGSRTKSVPAQPTFIDRIQHIGVILKLYWCLSTFSSTKDVSQPTILRKKQGIAE